jgi:hypothetical protein
LQALPDWIEDFSEWAQGSEEPFDAWDRVVVRVHQVSRGAGSGALVEGDYWFVFKLAEGKVMRLDIHSNRSQAFDAAGLSELPDPRI